MLRIDSCRVKYKDKVALDIDRPLVMERGEKLGVIGSNGAGKTTLVKSILGLTSYNGSITTEVELDDIAVHMQQNEYTNTVAVKHIMEMVLSEGLKDNANIMELIRFFEFENCLNKKYKALSGGEKQKLTLILVMAQNSPLTIFDEVTSGLDFETRQRLMTKLNEYYAKSDSNIIIVSHYYEELDNLVDKLLFLHEGRVVDFGDKKALFNKYCGNTIITIGNSEKAKELLKGFTHLKAPEHLIALRCDTLEEEDEISRLLSSNDINFKRSNNDIEIMTINAREAFLENKRGA